MVAVTKKTVIHNMKHLFLFSIIFVSIFLCCTDQKQELMRSRLEHQSINLGDKYIGYGGFLTYTQEGTVVGIEMNSSLSPFFCLKSTDSSSFYFWGTRGKGPNEFIMPYSIQRIDDRTIGVLDAGTKSYYEFAIPSENTVPRIEKSIRFQIVSSRIIKTTFDQYIALSLNKKMFSLMDSSGTKINEFFEYPYQNRNERKAESRAYAYQGTLAANPSKTKFVYSSFRGEIIHFYSIEENDIKVITKIENEYPLFKEENTVNTNGVSYDAQGKNGYIATYATDRYVYAIYSGQTVFEQTEKRQVNFEGNILRVFDWGGNLVKEYELDVPCSYICISDDDVKMWAIATDNNGEIVLVSFDLDNSIRHKVPPGARLYSFDVRTKDGKYNEDTQKIADSIRSLPADVPLYFTPNDRYSVQIDTIDNIVTTVLTLR